MSSSASTPPNQRETTPDIPGAAGFLTIRPPAKRGRLSKPRARLPCLNIKTSCPFEVAYSIGLAGNGEIVFFTRKRRECYHSRQFLRLISQDPEEIYNISINVIVGLDWGRLAVQKNSPGRRKMAHNNGGIWEAKAEAMSGVRIFHHTTQKQSFSASASADNRQHLIASEYRSYLSK